MYNLTMLHNYNVYNVCMYVIMYNLTMLRVMYVYMYVIMYNLTMYNEASWDLLELYIYYMFAVVDGTTDLGTWPIQRTMNWFVCVHDHHNHFYAVSGCRTMSTCMSSSVVGMSSHIWPRKARAGHAQTQLTRSRHRELTVGTDMWSCCTHCEYTYACSSAHQ